MKTTIAGAWLLAMALLNGAQAQPPTCYNLHAPGCETAWAQEVGRITRQAKAEGRTFEQAREHRNNGHYGYRMGVGDAYGQDYGPPADKDCPASPYFEAVRADERPGPQPEWGCRPGEACGQMRVYYGNTVMEQAPNRAMCEWSADRSNKRQRMSNRCWPLWNGKPNIQTEKWSCGAPAR